MRKFWWQNLSTIVHIHQNPKNFVENFLCLKVLIRIKQWLKIKQIKKGEQMWNKGGWSDSLLWALGSVDHKALDKNCKESMDSAHYSRYSSQSCHSSHNSHRSVATVASIGQTLQKNPWLLSTKQRLLCCTNASKPAGALAEHKHYTSWTQMAQAEHSSLHNTAQAEEKLHRADLTLCLRYNFVPLVCS